MDLEGVQPSLVGAQSVEAEIVAALRENLDSAVDALGRHDVPALRALAEQEARLVDSLHAIWARECEEFGCHEEGL